MMELIHPKQEIQRIEQKSPTIADQKKQSSPTPTIEQRDIKVKQEDNTTTTITTTTPTNNNNNTTTTATTNTQYLHEKIKLKEINPYLTCHLCKGYLIDATTISECLHSFCRSCIIKFLEEEDHSYCPVCEVIINKAKPNLKLDKTLQDIVYKLVPGLFLAEMLRRKRFYAERPGEAGGVSPEQRGEDTERTIFNPQDRISLSLEYIGDAETSGLILRDLKNTLMMEQQQKDSGANKKTTPSIDVQAESLLKRYLQCPGMCRIDVIKKFIRNKYNVNTDLFQIDILYKRVPLPLPDHYTLIDIAYIYTWKRNEPMRFYFRIIEKGNDELPDLTKMFTPIETPPLPNHSRLSNVQRATPTKKLTMTTSTPTAAISDRLIPIKSTPSPLTIKKRTPKKRKTPTKQPHRHQLPPSPLTISTPTSVPKIMSDKNDEYDFDKNCDNESEKYVKFESVQKKRDKDNEKSAAKCDEDNNKIKKVFTNITLNRTNNSEIVTKIEKANETNQVSVNGVNVEIKPMESSGGSGGGDVDDVKKEVKIEKTKEGSDEIETEISAPKTQNGLSEKELEQKKNEFFKSIELTSKKAVANLAKMIKQQQQQQIKSTGSITTSTFTPPVSKINVITSKPCDVVTSSTCSNSSTNMNGLKRKNSSPTKKPNNPKKTTKIIIQQKPGYVPILPLQKPEQNRNQLQSLFQNCRLNIPSSLSITLKENGETSRKPLLIPPVQNYIEILKIDEKEGKKTITLEQREKTETVETKKTNSETQKIDGVQIKIEPQKNESSDSPTPQKTEPQIEPQKNSDDVSTKSQSFQKIFEDSIKSTETSSTNESSQIFVEPSQNKRKNSDSMTVSNKKIKSEGSTRCSTPFPDVKLTIPRVVKNIENTHQTVANLHSSSLGLNYSVSVGKQTKDSGGLHQTKIDNLKSSPTTKNKNNEKEQKSNVKTDVIKSSPPKMNYPIKKLSPKITPSSPTSTASTTLPQLTPNQLLEKYNIQNLAQLSASINFNAAMTPPNYHQQMAALQQAMLLKHQFELQNRQKWFNSQGPLLQFESYLQKLNASKNQILGKDN